MKDRLSLLVAILLIAAACTGPAASNPPRPSPSAPAATPTMPSASPSASPESTPVVTPAPSAPAAPAWSSLDAAGATPAAREDHTWTLEPDARAGWLFGGRNGARVFDDLWRYDLASDAWTKVTPAGDRATRPQARFGHTATWVEGVGLVVWAGQGATHFFDDLWAYDPMTNRWRELPTKGATPAARYGSCASLGPDDRLWVSHGFTQDSGRFADTWAYDFTAGRWTDETPDGKIAPIRCLHDCLWTPDGRLVLYAGQTTGIPAIGDLWVLGGPTGWKFVADGPPPPRQLYALAELDNTAYVFGGGSKSGGYLRDLWLLDLTTITWRPEDPTGFGPDSRASATLLADPAGARLLLFGGKAAKGALGDLWQLTTGD